MAKFLGYLAMILGVVLVLGFAAADDGAQSRSRGDFEVFFNRLDTNMDGKLNRDEFLQMAERAKDKVNAREKLSKVFDMLDPDHKGITKDRFKIYLDMRK